MSVDAVKLFRPQAGDIVIVDFNKVNVTNVENAIKDLGVAVIAVHDIGTIQIWGMREQKDFSQEVAELKLKLDASEKEINRLNRIIKDDMVPKGNAGGVPIPQTSVGATSNVAVGGILPSVSKTT